MDYLDQLRKELKNKTNDKLANEKPTRYRGQQLPAPTRLAVAKAQLRATFYKQVHIDPLQATVKQCEEAEQKLYLLAQEGAPEAMEMMDLNDAKKREALKGLRVHWSQMKMLRKGYLAEGVSQGEANQAFGYICGQLETMPGVKVQTIDGRRKTDFDTVTSEHLNQVVNAIMEEIDVEKNYDPEGCPEYTARLDSQEELTKTQGHGRVIGDATEADTDDLLAEEYRLKDAMEARRRPVIIRKANAG
jgi:hypothetical protein